MTRVLRYCLLALVLGSGLAAGVVGALAASNAVPRVPYVHRLVPGSAGPDVAMLQRALIRAGFRPAKLRPTGYFGGFTEREASAFQASRHIPASGSVGRPTLIALWANYDASGRAVMWRLYAKQQERLKQLAAAKAAAAKQSAFEKRVLEAVQVSIAHSSEIGYTQGFERSNLPAYPRFPRNTDCSAWVIWIFRHALGAAKAPPMGWTGTLGVEGKRVDANVRDLRVGDLVLYGTRGYPWDHVEIYIGHGQTAGHGSPGIHVHPWNFWTPLEARRYGP